MQTTERNYVWYEKRGYAAALDAAEQSVGSIPYTEIDGYPFVIRAEALGAIRGLREEK